LSTTAIDSQLEDGPHRIKEDIRKKVEAVESWESGEESVASNTTSSSLQESVLLR
jgi:hypothetical protein